MASLSSGKTILLDVGAVEDPNPFGPIDHHFAPSEFLDSQPNGRRDDQISLPRVKRQRTMAARTFDADKDDQAEDRRDWKAVVLPYELGVKNPSTLRRSLRGLVKMIFTHCNENSSQLRKIYVRSIGMTRHHHKPVRVLSYLLSLIHELSLAFPTTEIRIDTTLHAPDVTTIAKQPVPVLCVEGYLYPFPSSLKFENSCLDTDRKPNDDTEKRMRRIASWWRDVLSFHFHDHLQAEVTEDNSVRLVNAQDCVDGENPRMSRAGVTGKQGEVTWLSPKQCRDVLHDQINSRLTVLRSAITPYLEPIRIEAMRRGLIDGAESIQIDVVPPKRFECGYNEWHYVPSTPNTMSICLEVKTDTQDPIMFWSIEPNTLWRSYRESELHRYSKKFPHFLEEGHADSGGWHSYINGRSTSRERCLPPLYDYLETTRLVINPTYRGMGLVPILTSLWPKLLTFDDHSYPELPIRIRTKSAAAAQSFRRHKMIEEESATDIHLSSRRAAHMIFWLPFDVRVPLTNKASRVKT